MFTMSNKNTPPHPNKIRSFTTRTAAVLGLSALALSQSLPEVRQVEATAGRVVAEAVNPSNEVAATLSQEQINSLTAQAKLAANRKIDALVALNSADENDIYDGTAYSNGKGGKTIENLSVNRYPGDESTYGQYGISADAASVTVSFAGGGNVGAVPTGDKVSYTFRNSTHTPPADLTTSAAKAFIADPGTRFTHLQSGSPSLTYEVSIGEDGAASLARTTGHDTGFNAPLYDEILAFDDVKDGPGNLATFIQQQIGSQN